MTDEPEDVDALLVGAGQANNPLARSLAKAGWSVALVERGEIGGTCVNTGCTPTKTLLASARVAHLARRAGEYGVETGEVSVQFDAVLRRTTDLVERFRRGSERNLQETRGLDLVRGDATFVGPRAVRVALREGATRLLRGGLVVIDVGCQPRRPPIPGLDSVAVLDSANVLDLAVLPPHLVVLGGGYIGVEYSQMFRRLGSQVTLIQKGEQLLSREDPDMAEALTAILGDDGIEILREAEVERVSGDRDEVRLSVRVGGQVREVVGSHLLVASGRTPNTSTLNLEATGVRTDDRGFIPVNDRLETNVPKIYALGDVNGGPAFTHVAHNDNQILRQNLLHNAGRTTAGRLIPSIVFTDPQFGRVGLTEGEARKTGHPVRIAKMPMRQIARAVEVGEDRGVLKAVVDARTDQILGCAVLGLEGGEIIAMVQIAMMGGVPYQRLRDDMFAHPSLARGLNGWFSQFVED